MSHGLRIWDAAGNLSFDSDLATGGVCIGEFTVSIGSAPLLFPDYPGLELFGLNTWDANWVDYALGYPRFTPVVSGNFLLFVS